jgi:hypothetical protein
LLAQAVIPATGEAKIGKIMVRGQSRQKKKKTCSKPMAGPQGKMEDPNQKNNQSEKRVEGMALVVEHLVSKCTALNSNPRTTKTKQNRNLRTFQKRCCINCI